MPSAPADLETAGEAVEHAPNPREVLRRSLIKGLAVLLPLVITLLVVSFVLGFIFQQLAPIVDAVVGAGPVDSEVLVTLATLLVFLAIVLVIGFSAEFVPGDHHLSDDFDHFMSSIPGVGSVYTSFNEMSELILDSDTDSFQEVKLVEYPGQDSYTVAFKTAETPDVVADATGNDDMITLFMPMAPNPVMGGFVIHVSRERVVDVDLTVEEGVRSIVTSGVAIDHEEGEEGTAHGDSDLEARVRNLDALEEAGSIAGVRGPPGATADEEDQAEPRSDADGEEP